MKQKPTQAQVKEEIEKLRSIKPKVRRETAFGDDNHICIDAQIEVLEEDLSSEEIESRFDGGEWDDRQYDNANEARYWVDGDEKESPSDGWKSLIQE